MKGCFLLVLLYAVSAFGQTQADVLTTDTVIKMIQSGIPTQIIIRTIASADKVAFNMMDMEAMIRSGINDDVFKAMAAKSAGRPIPGLPAQAVAPTDAPIPTKRDQDNNSAHTASLTQRVHKALTPTPKDKPIIEIQVVDTLTSQREYTQYIPGTPGHSATNCNGNATVYGTGGGNATINGTQNCTTTTNPGTAPSTVQRSIEQAHVQALMPDGRHITLWCQQGFRRCSKLSPGSYSAELDGNSVWIKGYDLDGTTTHKIKYHFEGGW